jgi:hypothetical protein
VNLGSNDGRRSLLVGDVDGCVLLLDKIGCGIVVVVVILFFDDDDDETEDDEPPFLL